MDFVTSNIIMPRKQGSRNSMGNDTQRKHRRGKKRNANQRKNGGGQNDQSQRSSKRGRGRGKGRGQGRGQGHRQGRGQGSGQGSGQGHNSNRNRDQGEQDQGTIRSSGGFERYDNESYALIPNLPNIVPIRTTDEIPIIVYQEDGSVLLTISSDGTINLNF